MTSPSKRELKDRLHNCWKKDIRWDLYPEIVKTVSAIYVYYNNYTTEKNLATFLFQGFQQLSNAISMPPTSVLAGLLMILRFCMSHSVTEVEKTDWIEPVLLWVSICMPTMFLSQVNIFGGRGISDSHELAVFLQLYGGGGKCNE